MISKGIRLVWLVVLAVFPRHAAGSENACDNVGV